jgi:TetR/AcrR family transcriptional regulator, fatty acid metabolism regulator protein
MAEQKKTNGRKDRIMEAALRCFAANGFQESTIAEISKKAGVSEATIYEHFGTKEDLLFAIPEKVTLEAIAETERVLPYIKGAEARIRAIIRGYIRIYGDNPDYSALVLLQLTPNRRFRQTNAHATIRKAAHMLLDCIREGVADGTFQQNINPHLVRSMLLGTIEHLFIQWHLQGESAKESIMDLLDPFMEIVLKGIRAKTDEPGLTLRLNLDKTQVFKDLLQANGVREKKGSGVRRKDTRAR